MTAQTAVPFAPQRAFVYQFIPRLKHLLPRLRGLPGVEYAIIPIAYAREYQDDKWLQVEGTVIFTITNPATTQSCDCMLVAQGKPVPGQGHLSGARKAHIDRRVYDATGFTNPLPPKPDTKPTTKGATTNAPQP